MKTNVNGPSTLAHASAQLQRRPSNTARPPHIWALVAFAALFAVSQVPCGAQTFLFDFGSTTYTTGNGAAPADDPVNFWNNVTTTVGQSDTGSLLNLITTDNSVTSVGLMMLSRFNGANEAGTQASTLFPSDATRDSLFGNTELFSGLANVFPSFKLIGLDPAGTYDFTFYASRLSVTDNRETGYTLTGANAGFAALNASANVDNFATALGIAPTAEGEITIAIGPTANNVNANHFTYLGVMEMSVVPEPSSFALLIGGAVLLTSLRRKNRLG